MEDRVRTAVNLDCDWGVILIIELDDPKKVLVVDHEWTMREVETHDDDFIEMRGWEVFG